MRTREQVLDKVKLDPNYGSILRLWIYSPVRVEWIEVDSLQPTGKLFTYDVDNSSFLAVLTWLNLGGFFMPERCNPNDARDLHPVYLPADFLQLYGVQQEDLRFDDLRVASQEARAVDSDAMYDRKQTIVKQTKEDKLQTKLEGDRRKAELIAEIVAKPSAFQLQLERLTDWDAKSTYSTLFFKLAASRGYTFEEKPTDHGVHIKLNQLNKT